MRFLEIIEVRLAGNNREKASGRLTQLVDEMKQKKEHGREQECAVTLYNHAAVDMDFSIHIACDAETVEESGSPLGLTIAAALKEFGLVNHRVWVEKNSRAHSRRKI